MQESLPSHNSNNYLNICSNLFNALLRLNLWNQYFILVAILCGTELTCGVLGFLYSEEVSLTLKQELLTGIQAHYNTSPLYNGITFAWDHIQQQVNLHFSKSNFSKVFTFCIKEPIFKNYYYYSQLSCCGVRNYDDWFNISAWPGELYVPNSCCIPSFEHMDGNVIIIL